MVSHRSRRPNSRWLRNPLRAIGVLILLLIPMGVPVLSRASNATFESIGQPLQFRPATPVATSVPAGFTDGLVGMVSGPTALAFTPDGRMLVTRQPGEVRVYNAGSLAFDRAAVNLQSRICFNEERGVLGIAVDPQFSSNRFIYLYYTSKRGGVCPINDPLNPNNPVNRVSRFVLQDDNLVLTSTEVVLVDNIPSSDGDHNGGDLHFGNDGYLYVSIGDNDCHYTGSGLCGTSNLASRDEFILLGKILRITRDGGIPPDNPFLGPGTARCNITGRADAGLRCQETFAWGLRNPFRMAFDPNTAGTRFFINDDGQNSWEEIDLGQAGADYGWPCREGAHNQNTSSACAPLPPNLVDPIFDYSHSTHCASITGGAFVPNGVWPPEYDGAYLYGDYVCGRILRLVAAGGGGYTATNFLTGMGANSAVAMTFGPHGGGQALYYTSYAGGGQVRRIAYAGAPVASLSANPASGPAPLTVTFDSAGSSDPGGSALTFDWTFGDGAVLGGGTSPTTTHTYTASGVYTASLVVRNIGGTPSAPANAQITAGSLPPVPAITLPVSGTTFSVGEVIAATGQATDPEDGPLPASALSWEVRLHHVDAAFPGNAHWHPHHSAEGTASTSFTTPAPEDLGAVDLSYVEIRLTATDSTGLAATVSRIIQPQRVPITFATAPAGMQVTVNGLAVTGAATITSWVGYVLNVTAASPQAGYVFAGWSDGGAASHAITTPATSTTYTAAFVAGPTSTPTAAPTPAPTHTSPPAGRRIFLPLAGAYVDAAHPSVSPAEHSCQLPDDWRKKPAPSTTSD